jgi:hypothetical protein
VDEAAIRTQVRVIRIDTLPALGADRLTVRVQGVAAPIHDGRGRIARASGGPACRPEILDAGPSFVTPGQQPLMDTPENVRRLIADTIQDVHMGRLHESKASVVFAGLNVALSLAELEVHAQRSDLG